MGLTDLLARALELLALFYGAWASFKALRARPYDDAAAARMLRFWAVLSAFGLYRTYLEWALAFWVPFYNELRLSGLVWLVMPGSEAPRYFFDRVLHPAITVAGHYARARAAPQLASQAARLVAAAQPGAFALVAKSLSKSELRLWARAFGSQQRLVALELERRRRRAAADTEADEGAGAGPAVADPVDVLLLSAREPLDLGNEALELELAREIGADGSEGLGVGAYEEERGRLLDAATSASPLAPARMRAFVASVFSSASAEGGAAPSALALGRVHEEAEVEDEEDLIEDEEDVAGAGARGLAPAQSAAAAAALGDPDADLDADADELYGESWSPATHTRGGAGLRRRRTQASGSGGGDSGGVGALLPLDEDVQL